VTGAAHFEAPLTPYADSVVEAAIAAADEKLGRDTVVLDLRGLTDAFDVMVLISGGNDRQVRAIAEEVVRRTGTSAHARPVHVEGLAGAEWVALDYVDVIVHVFDEAAREYYDLEHLWRSAPARRPASAR
jgi:ribosome-associated protein